MNVSDKAVHVVVATGFIDRKFAQNELFELGTFLHNDNFWNAQIEQIYITPKQEVELVPRVGDHVLFWENLVIIKKNSVNCRLSIRKG